MKSIIISGITGFIGTNLKEYLNKSYTVFGVSRTKDKIQNTFSYNEIIKNGLDNYLAFIHLAGKAHDLKNTVNSSSYFEANTDLTIKLFDLFLKSDCNVFIFMSTVKAVADSVDYVLTEDHKPNPITAYGKSKRAAEEYLLSKKLAENKKVYILRPCMIHGPNNKGNLNLLHNVINKGIPYPLGKFENRRSFLSVQNLSFIVENLIKLEPQSGVFNIADDEQISTKTLVKIIGEGIDKKARILNINQSIIILVAKIGGLLGLPLNSERLMKLTENYCVSNSKIKKVLNTELPISTREGIKITVRSFKKNNTNV